MHQPIRKHWFGDDPFKSLFFNSLSVSIPESERFIASTAKIARLSVHSEQERRAIDSLIHEEEAHTRVHESYNDLLRRQGYAISRFERFEKRLAGFFAQRSLKTRLALCLCGEFFTAVMGRHLIEKRTCEAQGVDERMRALWTWHSLEELDHRNTAFDLYLSQGGGYFRRAAVMILMTNLYFFTHLACFLALLRQDRVRLTSAKRSEGLSFLLGKDGFYRSVIAAWFAFFRPGFHPKHDLRLEPGLASELHHNHIEEHFIGAVVAST